MSAGSRRRARRVIGGPGRSVGDIGKAGAVPGLRSGVSIPRHLTILFTTGAAYRKWQRRQARVGNVGTALRASAVTPLGQSFERRVHAAERLGFQLNQGNLDVLRLG